jgi:hypothetical protein
MSERLREELEWLMPGRCLARSERCIENALFEALEGLLVCLNLANLSRLFKCLCNCARWSGWQWC